MPFSPFVSRSRTSRLFAAMACAIAASWVSTAYANAVGDARLDPELGSLLKARLEAESKSFCLGAAVIEKEIKYALVCPTGGPQANAATSLFEIGSLSKTLNGLLLADAERRGKVRLDDSVGKLLTSSEKLPKDVAQITLKDLVTHTSGLPRLPQGYRPTNQLNPYAGLTPEAVLDSLSATQLATAPGARFSYSNLGPMLLSNALVSVEGKGWDQLLSERVLSPAKMRSTFVTVPADVQPSILKGDDFINGAGSRWDMAPNLAGAGGVRASLLDVASFVRMNLAPYASQGSQAVDAELLASITRSHTQLVQRSQVGEDVAYGWFFRDMKGKRVLWHNGATGGFRSYAAFSPETGRGVVVLSASDAFIEDIGLHLMDVSYPLKAKRVRVPYSVEEMDRLIGQYAVPQGELTLEGGNGRLFVKAQGRPSVEIIKGTDGRYVSVNGDYELKLEAGASTRLTFIRQGTSSEATLKASSPNRDRPARLSADLVGIYVLPVGPQFKVSIEGESLYLTLPQGRKIEMFSTEPDKCFARDSSMRLEFVRGANGAVEEMRLLQGDRQPIPLKRQPGSPQAGS